MKPLKRNSQECWHHVVKSAPEGKEPEHGVHVFGLLMALVLQIFDGMAQVQRRLGRDLQQEIVPFRGDRVAQVLDLDERGRPGKTGVNQYGEIQRAYLTHEIARQFRLKVRTDVHQPTPSHPV